MVGCSNWLGKPHELFLSVYQPMILLMVHLHISQPERGGQWSGATQQSQILSFTLVSSLLPGVRPLLPCVFLCLSLPGSGYWGDGSKARIGSRLGLPYDKNGRGRGFCVQAVSLSSHRDCPEVSEPRNQLNEDLGLEVCEAQALHGWPLARGYGHFLASQ